MYRTHACNVLHLRVIQYTANAHLPAHHPSLSPLSVISLSPPLRLTPLRLFFMCLCVSFAEKRDRSTDVQSACGISWRYSTSVRRHYTQENQLIQCMRVCPFSVAYARVRLCLFLLSYSLPSCGNVSVLVRLCVCACGSGGGGRVSAVSSSESRANVNVCVLFLWCCVGLEWCG